MSIPSRSFASGAGDAVFNFAGVADFGGRSDITLVATLKDSGGVTGKKAKFVVTHDDDFNKGTGTKDNVARTTGLAP